MLTLDTIDHMKAIKYGIIVLAILLISIPVTIFYEGIGKTIVIDKNDSDANPPSNQATTWANNNTDSPSGRNITDIILPVARSSEESLVPNYGFEEGLDSAAAGWTYRNDSSARAYRVKSPFCEGNYSYYMWSNMSTLSAYSESFNVVSGGSYNVSFYSKTVFPLAETGLGYYVVLLAKNSSSEATVQFSVFTKTTTDWTKYECNWEIPGYCGYTEAIVRLTLILANNTGAGRGTSVWLDSIVVKPQVRSVICSQPFLLDYDNFPSELSFSAYFMNATENPFLDVDDFAVKLDDKSLTVKSLSYNESTRLFDVRVDLPVLEKGKYMLKLVYGSEESLNFKGVNVYQYTGNFSFIHWTDIHYNPPNIGFENQVNKTLQILKNLDPEFIQMTGDMHSSEVNYQRFYAIMKSMDFNIPIFFANGNHEKESVASLNNAVLYMGERKHQLGNEYPFTFNYGNYCFIGLDSGMLPYSSSGNISDVQCDWLKSELQNNRDKSLITFCHHPLNFLGKNSFWSNKTVAQEIIGMFSEYGVATNFAGHSHRSDVSIFNGMTYYTTVSGHNDTHWVGIEPFPPSGFRTIQIANNSIVDTSVTNLFSYYNGYFAYKDSM